MGWLNRLSNLRRREQLNRDLEEELQFHIDARMRDNLGAGMTAEAARQDARRRFGNRTLAQEKAHEANVIRWLEATGQDLLYAVRSLWKAPGFAAVAIITLALGIGANTAMFTVVDGVLLRPLPFPQPDRLFLISYRPLHSPFAGGPGLADQHYLEFRRHNRSFEQVATFGRDSITLTGAGDAVRLQAAEVTASFFPALQVNPAIGRPLVPEEEDRKGRQVAVLSDKLWRSHFGADANILGKAILLDGTPHKVIGVMPAGFAFPQNTELWLGLNVGGDRGNSYFRPVVGRLKPSVSRQQAQAEWEALAQHLAIGRHDVRSDMAAEMLPLNELLAGSVRRTLLIFMGAVAFVLLIACANVANLLLMRGTARQQEIAVRAALGASRGRLIRQLLTESTVVSLAGSVAGIVSAILAVPALLALAPAGRIPRLADIHVDGRVLAFSLALGACTAVLFGFVPAIHTTGAAVRDFLSRGGRAITQRRDLLRSTLVVWEIALALVLLTGAGLMLKSFLRMRAVDPGFRAENIITLTVDLPDSTYHTAGAIQDFQRDALVRLSALPGVDAAGTVNWVPFLPMLISGDFHRDDGIPLPRGFLVAKPAVTPDYFRVMGIRLLGGRAFLEKDKGSAPGVAIITKSVARTLWPGDDPVGKRITLQDNPKPEDWLTIVGIVEDVRQQSLTEKPRPAIYQPYAQVRRPDFLRHMSFAVRTAANPVSLAPGMRAVLQEVDRSQPVLIAAMTDLIAASTADTWFQTRLIATFSLLALVLSAIGIYGVLAYAVTERTREIGIRMALGAEKKDITRMVLDRSLILAGAGIALGALGSIAVTRVLARFLFEVKPGDPATLVLVAGILAAVAIVAGLLPARRASKVDPLVALRWE